MTTFRLNSVLINLTLSSQFLCLKSSYPSAGGHETLHRQEARGPGQVREGRAGADQEGERRPDPRGGDHPHYRGPALAQTKKKSPYFILIHHLSILGG